MLVKIARVVFFVGLALFFFGVAFPYLEIFLGLAALVLAIVEFL